MRPTMWAFLCTSPAAWPPGSTEQVSTRTKSLHRPSSYTGQKSGAGTSHNLRALRVGGDSMTPTIPEGAIVVIDLSDRIFAKRRIFCVNKIESGEYVASIKRVQKIFRGHLLLGDNPEYDAEATDMEWTDLCVGRVIWMWRNLENA